MADGTFDELYAAHLSYVRRFLLRLCNGNKQVAEDLTQETFFQAFRSIHRFEGNCRVETWLCSIAQKVFYDFLRKEKKQRRLESMRELDRSAGEDTGDFAESQQSLERDIVAALGQFPRLTAKVLLYRLFQDMPYSEISGLLNISENSAKVMYHRGRIRLKGILEKEYGYEI